MSHPDPDGPAATQPWRVGDQLWNPVTRERAVILEMPVENPTGRARAEMTALVGSRVLGEHLHPGLIERFTVLGGEPGARFAYMLDTLFGIAGLGHVDAKGMPSLLQMSLIGRELFDTVRFKSPPPAMQQVVFAAMAPLAHALGYRATYPQLSRSLPMSAVTAGPAGPGRRPAEDDPQASPPS